MGKKGSILVGVIVAVLSVIFIFGLVAWGKYNSLVSGRNAAIKSLADVEAAYQRRLDTIPKFAKTAQFSAQFQLKLIKEYAQAREGLKNAATSGNPDILQKAAEKAFGGLMIAVRQEAVPQAKTDQLTELNAGIENVERVINHERDAYNEAVMNFGNSIQSAGGKFLIGLFGWQFEPMKSFTAQPGAEKSPNYDLKLE